MSQHAPRADLHNDAERVLVLREERVVVAHDIRVVEPPQQLDLKSSKFVVVVAARQWRGGQIWRYDESFDASGRRVDRCIVRRAPPPRQSSWQTRPAPVNRFTPQSQSPSDDRREKNQTEEKRRERKPSSPAAAVVLATVGTHPQQ